MFMVKEELTNIKNLFKVRLKSAKNGLIVYALILSGLFLLPFISNVIEIVNNNTWLYHDVSDLSGFIIFGLVIGFIVTHVMYRTINVKLSVYPQTNNSRLISSMLINYFIVAMVLVSILVMYLINLGVFKLMAAFSYNIVFALNIDTGFIVAGFFVYLAYGFLIVSVIELIGTILRKWTYYAAVALTTLFALLIVNLARVIDHLSGMLAFLIAEPSLLMFFLKAAGLWLAITAVTLVINRYTVYYKSHNQVLRKSIVIACIIIAVAIIVVLPGIMFNVSVYDNSNETYWEWDEEGNLDGNNFINFERIVIDVSHIPDGSRINIDGTNIRVMQPGQWTSFSNDYSAIVSGAEELSNIQGDTIIVEYRPAWFLVNGIEVFKYTNAQISVHLEGNMLIIDYSFDNVHVMLMPIWSLARQFDYFKDAGVLNATALGFTSGGHSAANIWIHVE
jgi:hypothetical protein